MAEDRSDATAQFRELPPIGDLRERLAGLAAARTVPADLLLAWVREGTEEARAAVRAAASGEAALPARGREGWAAWIEERVQARLEERRRTQPRGVVNATGILLHTNLGRAPLPSAAVVQVSEAARGYSNLELDLESGRRSSRLATVRALLPVVTGAEAGLAVHNNAAAVFLALTALAAGREVIVARGHLVEIGGSFRLPEIMASSGARLVEVGSTNRTRLADYERAIGPQTALLLQVHPSNFRMVGFTEEVPTAELAAVARARALPLVYDIGSGALRRHGELAFGEPTVEQALQDGADLVAFSGDKLLGGPQAGILVGRREWIDRLARHPVARVVRLDKTTLAALAATLEAWCDPATVQGRVPLLALLARTPEELEAIAESLAGLLRESLGAAWSVETVGTSTEVGGGSLPGVLLPSRAVALSHPAIGADAISRALRLADPPVCGRIEEGKVLLEARALLPGDEERIAQASGALRILAER